MKPIKRFLTAALCITVFAACSGCKKENDINIKSDDYIAGGTIPASAKVYPIVDEALEMTLSDARGLLSEDDIWTLTHYVDLWASGNDTRGSGFQKEDVASFTSQAKYNEAVLVYENASYDFKVDGTQILTIGSISDDEVEIPYVVQVSGKDETAGINEGTYQLVDALRFKKNDGNWYLSGVTSICMEEPGDIIYKRDTITGQYTIVTPEAEE